MAWESTDGPKVAILVPSTGLVSMEWAGALAAIVARAGVPIGLQLNKHYRLDYSRNDLVEWALSGEYSHMLFIDTDIFPFRYDPVTKGMSKFPDFLGRFLSLQYPIVSGLYWTKKNASNLYSRIPGEPYSVKTLAGPLSEFVQNHFYVDAVGLGCCLIDRRVFERLRYPWFEFHREVVGGKMKEMSEDISFGLAASAAGFPTLVDGSVVCKHESKAFLVWQDQLETGAIFT